MLPLPLRALTVVAYGLLNKNGLNQAFWQSAQSGRHNEAVDGFVLSGHLLNHYYDDDRVRWCLDARGVSSAGLAVDKSRRVFSCVWSFVHEHLHQP